MRAATRGVLGIPSLASDWRRNSRSRSRSPRSSSRGTARGARTRQLPDGTGTIRDISIRDLLMSAWGPEDGEYRNLPAWAMRDH